MAASKDRIHKMLGTDYARAAAIRSAMKLGEQGKKQAEEAMIAINGILDAYGVEAIRGDYYVDRFHHDIVATYVNMGDTYEPTVLYETDTGKFKLTSFGDWVESKGKKYRVY